MTEDNKEYAFGPEVGWLETRLELQNCLLSFFPGLSQFLSCWVVEKNACESSNLYLFANGQNSLTISLWDILIDNLSRLWTFDFFPPCMTWKIIKMEFLWKKKTL